MKRKLEKINSNIDEFKKLLSENITNKGVETSHLDSFKVINENITKISAGGNNDDDEEITDTLWETLQLKKNIYHTTGKSKNLVITSSEKCGDANDNGEYDIKFAVNNGANSNDDLYRSTTHTITIPGQIYDDASGFGKIVQNEDGSLNYIQKSIDASGNSWERYDTYGEWASGQDLKGLAYRDGRLYSFVIAKSYGMSRDLAIVYYDINTKTFGTEFTIQESYNATGEAIIIVDDMMYCVTNYYVYKYDFNTKSYTRSSSCPYSYTDFGCEYYNGKIYKLGSYTYVYDIASNSWSAIQSMPTKLTHFRCHQYNGKLYCIGGRQTSGSSTSIISVYNIASNSWSTISGFPISLFSYASTIVDDKIYVMRGKQTTSESYYNYFYVYDITNNITTKKDVIGSTMASVGGACCVDKKIYLMNISFETYSGNHKYGRHVEIFDVEKDQWEYVPAQRADVYSIARLDNKIYFLGGSSSTVVDCYNVDTDTWEKETDLPFVDNRIGTAILNNKLYCVGGLNGYKQATFKVTNRVYTYDFTSKQWTQMNNFPVSLNSAMLVTCNNKLYCVGGDGQGSNIHIYDESSDSWSIGASYLTGKKYCTAVAVNDKIYCIASYNGSSYASKVEIYDTSTDSWEYGAETNVKTGNSATIVIDNKIYCIGGSKYDSMFYSDSYSKLVSIYDVESNEWVKGQDIQIPTTLSTAYYKDGKISLVHGLMFSTMTTYRSYLLKSQYLPLTINKENTFERTVKLKDNYSFPMMRGITYVESLNNPNPNVSLEIEIESQQ